MAPRRLLVLDDDTTVGQVLLLGAQVSGFEARQCTELAAFIDVLERWQPSHVVVDLSLPGTPTEAVIDGLAGAGCRATVIVCSGAGVADLEQALAQARGRGLQAAGVLPKPFTLAALRALLGGA